MQYTIAEARLKCHRHMKYFSRALMSLIPVESPGIGTMGVDARWRLYYDPAFLAKHPIEVSAGVVTHELLHCLHRHHKRSEELFGPNPSPEQLFTWNLATDAALNCMVRDFGLKLPAGCVYPETFGFPVNLTSEQYYDLLLKLPRQKIEVKVQFGGSCSDGQQRPWEGPLKGNGKGGKGGEAEGSGSGQDEIPAGLADHDQMIIERATMEEASKNRGTMPAGLRRLVDDSLAKPKVNWRRELFSQVRRAVTYVQGYGDFSYRRPRRRNLPDGLILPGTVKPLVNLAGCVDSSGSMSPKDIQEALRELNGIAQALGVPFWCFVGDTRAEFAKKITRADQLEIIGGGGTDMAYLIRHAQEHSRADVVVCITDGLTGWPEYMPQRVIACITSGGRESAPEWIQTVKMEA